MRSRSVTLKFRETKKNGEGSINFVYDHTMCPSGVWCKSEDFKNGIVLPSDPKAKYKNNRLLLLKAKIEEAIGNEKLSREMFTDLCKSIISPEAYQTKLAEMEASKKKSFLDCYDERASQAQKDKTSQTYAHTRAKVEEYLLELHCERLLLDDVTCHWLENFERWLRDKGTKTNGIGIHMRNIRTVCNYALKEEYTSNYPFKQYKIKKEATAKRCLTVEQLRELRDFECDVRHERYRDIFMLMFYFRGVNAVDLFNATHENVRNGRFEYRRSKTGHFFSIKIEPEAQAILDKYSGGEHLINCIDDCKWDTFMQHMDKELKKIGPTTYGKHGKKVEILPICPDLTSYWSRHTWATMAAEIDIPKDTIGKALGHEWACVTDTYIKFNERKVDEASRSVIDYLNGDFKSQKQWQDELNEQQERAAQEQKRLLEESRRKQEELLEANRKMQEQLLKLLNRLAV